MKYVSVDMSPGCSDRFQVCFLTMTSCNCFLHRDGLQMTGMCSWQTQS